MKLKLPKYIVVDVQCPFSPRHSSHILGNTVLSQETNYRKLSQRGVRTYCYFYVPNSVCIFLMPTYSIVFITLCNDIYILVFCTYYSVLQMIKLQRNMRPTRDRRLWGQNLHVIEVIRMPTFLSGYL